MKKLLMAYLERINVKGKVKKRRGCRKGWMIVKSKGKPIFCKRNGSWKLELEQRLQKNDEIVLLALGNAKYEVLAYLNRRKDIEILKLETKYVKKLEKGTGLKAIVRRRKLEIGNIMHKRTEENKLESKQSGKIDKRKRRGDEKTI